MESKQKEMAGQVPSEMEFCVIGVIDALLHNSVQRDNGFNLNIEFLYTWSLVVCMTSD